MLKNLVFIIVFISLSGIARSADKIYLFTEQLPPYSMTVDEDKQFAHSSDDIAGLCADIVKEVFKVAKIPYKMKLRNWNYGITRVLRAVNNGIFCTARTEERENKYSWIGPLTKYTAALFAKPDSTIALDSIEAAKKYKIGGYTGDFMSEYLVKNGFNISTVANDVMNPSRLVIGSIDLWVADELSGPYIASGAINVSNLTKVISFDSTPMYLALNKETPYAIVERLQKAIESMRSSGRLGKIEQRYRR